MGQRRIDIILLEDAIAFIGGLPPHVRKKIYYNIDRVLYGERDVQIFKKLENTEIWEFRTFYDKMSYRLFAFWDTTSGTFIIATHGMVKKTRKTPKNEIEKAERLRREYFMDKKTKQL